MTDKQPTLEQIKEFREWCGFKLVNDIVWIDEHDNRIHVESPIDLNNLFKYAVPATIEKLQSRHHCSYKRAEHELFRRQMSKTKTNEYVLALFWVVWEVINNDKQ